MRVKMADPKPEAENVEAINPQVQMIKFIKIMLMMFVLILFAFGGMTFYLLKSMQNHTETVSQNLKVKSGKSGIAQKEGSEKEGGETAEKEEKGEKEEGHKEEAHKEEGGKEDKTASNDVSKPLYYKFSPSIVTSIAAKDQMRYLRVDVELVSKDKAMIENITNYAPLFAMS